MSKSIVEIAKLEGRRFAIILATAASLLLSLIFISRNYHDNVATVDSHINSTKQNFKYWIETGDTFNIQRAISNMVMSVPNIYGLKIQESQTKYVIAEANINIFKYGPVHYADGNLFFLHSKIDEIGNGKFQFVVTAGISIWPIVYIILFSPLVYLLLSFFIQKTFAQFSNKLVEPIKEFSDKLENTTSAHEFLNIEVDTKTFKELQVFKKNLRDLGQRMVSAELKNQDLMKKSILFAVAKQVAHDIRSPLTGLETLANLEKGNLTNERYNLLIKSIGRIRSVANDLLIENKKNTLSTPGSQEKEAPEDSRKVIYPPIDIYSLLKDSIESKLLEYKAKTNIKLKLQLENTPTDICVAADKEVFSRVISNLINNSIEAIPLDRDGFVFLNCYLDNNEVVVEIRDNGIGIPPGELTKLFTEGLSYNKPAGNGLGLVHAKRVIESFRGNIKMASQVQVGTTVYIRLPKYAE